MTRIGAICWTLRLDSGRDLGVLLGEEVLDFQAEGEFDKPFTRANLVIDLPLDLRIHVWFDGYDYGAGAETSKDAEGREVIPLACGIWAAGTKVTVRVTGTSALEPDRDYFVGVEALWCREDVELWAPTPAARTPWK